MLVSTELIYQVHMQFDFAADVIFLCVYVIESVPTRSRSQFDLTY